MPLRTWGIMYRKVQAARIDDYLFLLAIMHPKDARTTRNTLLRLRADADGRKDTNLLRSRSKAMDFLATAGVEVKTA